MQKLSGFIFLLVFLGTFLFSIFGKNGAFVALFVLVLVGLVGWGISLYNKIKLEQIKITEARANVDVYLQQRYDEISAIYKIAQEYKLHELSTFKEIVKLRQMALSPEFNPEQLNEINNRIEQRLPTVMATFENYPELRSNQNFLQLQEAISENEDNIAASRSSLNGYVNRYNTTIAMFPAVLFASIFKFQPAALYEAPADKKENPLI